MLKQVVIFILGAAIILGGLMAIAENDEKLHADRLRQIQTERDQVKAAPPVKSPPAYTDPCEGHVVCQPRRHRVGRGRFSPGPGSALS